MTHKQQKKQFEKMCMYSKAMNDAEKYADTVVQGFLFNSAFVLADKFGFREKRIIKYIEELAKASMSYSHEAKSGNPVTFTELNETFKDEYKVDLMQEFKKVYEKVKGDEEL